MGAQTTCNLLEKYGNRVPAVLLRCPGIYDKRVVNVRFDNSKFTNILRTEKSWNNSNAFDIIRSYLGKTIVAIGSDDKVIPDGVVDRLIDCAMNGFEHKYKNVDH